MDDFLNELKAKNKEFSDEYVNMMKQYYAKLMNNPVELQNQLNNLKNGIDPEGGITITPDKYCCIKTTDENGQKIFINLVSSDKVDAPVEQHILEMNNQHGVRIPMSLSEKAEDHDVKGNPCEVYDAIFNPGVLKKTESEPMVLQFIMACIGGRLKERFKKTINVQNFIRLKNVTYKGKAVRPQRIRARKVKIDEIISDANAKDKKGNNEEDSHKMANEINKEVNERGKTPNWNFVIIKSKVLTGALFKEINKEVKEKVISSARINFNLLEANRSNENFEYYTGFNANPKYGFGLLLVVELELLGKSSGIRLNISDEALTMYCGKFYSLELNLPYKVNSKNSKSIFITEQRLLYIYMPFYEKDINEWKAIEEKKNEKEKAPRVELEEDYLFDVIK